MSVLRSVKDTLPKLIKRMASIVKNAVVSDNTGKDKTLVESKDLAKERKSVKDTLYTFIDINFSNLSKDVQELKSAKSQIVINPEDFETLQDRFYTEIRPFCEIFITEKRMSPTVSKYVAIVFSGFLLEYAKKNNKGK